MIPPFNTSMVLPPFIGDDPGIRAATSPYQVTMLEIASRFATSTERMEILRGLISYRKALLDIGIVGGFQWIDGSFVEDVETVRRRPPADVDIVTFGVPPLFTDPAEFRQWFGQNSHLFDHEQTKAQYKCDAFFVSLRIRPDLLVDDTRYWFGLFSHQRETALWKGMLQVPLLSDDDEATQYIDLNSFDDQGGENA